VNQGGEPGHDDYGLPPVDIQVPDDARELYRDVLAYHRELRALRRQERAARWRAPLRRGGMIVPLIAGCLVLAMIAGMVLTMFSANPYLSGLARQESSGTRNSGQATNLPGTAGASGASGIAGPSGRASVSRSAVANASGGPSQPVRVQLSGQAISVRGPRVPLRRLTGAALAIVPARCRCATMVRELAAQAMSAGVTIYLVGRRGSLTELNSLAPDSAGGTVMLAIDADNALTTAYGSSGLTILFVDARGSVTARPNLRAGFQIEPKLKLLKQPR
jgi:hypothetical protein